MDRPTVEIRWNLNVRPLLNVIAMRTLPPAFDVTHHHVIVRAMRLNPIQVIHPATIRPSQPEKRSRALAHADQ